MHLQLSFELGNDFHKHHRAVIGGMRSSGATTSDKNLKLRSLSSQIHTCNHKARTAKKPPPQASASGIAKHPRPPSFTISGISAQPKATSLLPTTRPHRSLLNRAAFHPSPEHRDSSVVAMAPALSYLSVLSSTFQRLSESSFSILKRLASVLKDYSCFGIHAPCWGQSRMEGPAHVNRTLSLRRWACVFGL